MFSPNAPVRTVVLGSARASLRVTKRALGFASCIDQDAFPFLSDAFPSDRMVIESKCVYMCVCFLL